MNNSVLKTEVIQTDVAGAPRSHAPAWERTGSPNSSTPGCCVESRHSHAGGWEREVSARKIVISTIFAQKTALLRLSFVALTLLAAACAPMSQPPAPSTERWPTPPPRQPEQPQRPAPKAPPKPTDGINSSDVQKPSAAVQSLLNQGWSHYRREDYPGALAYAERAQRIDARTPDIYLLMASAQFALYRMGVAEQLARKGLAISASGSPVYRQLQDLLARIAASGR